MSSFGKAGSASATLSHVHQLATDCGSGGRWFEFHPAVPDKHLKLVHNCFDCLSAIRLLSCGEARGKHRNRSRGAPQGPMKRAIVGTSPTRALAMAKARECRYTLFGTGGGRFKSCHSDHYLAQSNKHTGTDCGTDIAAPVPHLHANYAQRAVELREPAGSKRFKRKRRLLMRGRTRQLSGQQLLGDSSRGSL